MIAIKHVSGLAGGYPEAVEGTHAWYFCKRSAPAFSFCDLYEAEELLRQGHPFPGMACHLIHYPEGRVYTPFPLREKVYVEAPVWENEGFWLLRVDFAQREIGIWRYLPMEDILRCHVRLPLAEVKDCYNLRLEVSPLILTRWAGEEKLEIIWPERRDIPMEKTETVLFRDGERLYTDVWYEDPDYRTETLCRDWRTGRELERFSGSLLRLPGEIYWRT